MNIKKLSITFILAIISLFSISNAAPIFNAPAIRIQPNGDTLHCLLSGDEYFHRLHDEAGYTIIQNPRTGYWVYADTVHYSADRWDVVATNYVAGSVNPASVGLHPNIGVDQVTWENLQHRYDVPIEKTANGRKTSGANHGTLNNIVIFIRFSDETEITTSLSTINAMFNDSSSTATSMYNYFKTVSYGKIFIPTHYYPTPNGNNIISYQDSLPRSYYMPYNATTNPNGYNDDTESRLREFGLLQRAVEYVNANYPVSTSLNLDMDNDGKVDNICFVVKGTYTGWSELLWPHKWSLYDRYVYINGKRVYTFNLQLEGSGSHYFSSSTFCHEMFHTLGAPDLYRYNVNTNVSGVGSWDLMCSNSTPPQHMSTYMKMKYGNWIDSIPQITVPGTYTLHSLGDNSYENCAYKIAAQEPHQWYVLEYRDNTEFFETALPGKGLLIFRIDDRYSGNASYNGTTTFDEVYLFRPGGYNDSVNGTVSQAYFSGNTSRTSFTPSTNPYPWLTGNVIDTTFSITNVTSPGVTISFTYSDLRGCRLPSDLLANNITGHSANLHWSGNSPQYIVQWRQGSTGAIQSTTSTSPSLTLNNLTLNTEYQWRVRGICGTGDTSTFSSWFNLRTASCPMPETMTIGTSDTTLYFLPLNTYYNYSYTQMLYTTAEIGGEMNINTLSFNYSYSNNLSTKDSCIIYLGNTTKSSFSGTGASEFVPLSQMQKVYEGPMFFSQGWNTIELDSSFHFNGTGNLVVAIDDNSGDYDGSNYRFYCSSTGSQYRTLSYYSDSYNYNPTASSYSGSKKRLQYRADIRFGGCPVTTLYDITVNNANSNLGYVQGGGQYAYGETATLSATPNSNSVFVCWISNGDTITANPYSFTVVGNKTFTAHFRLATRTVSVTSANSNMGSVSGGGDYSLGTTATISATPNNGCSFLYWISEGDTITDNPYSFTVAADKAFTAYFQQITYTVNVSSSDLTMGHVSGGGEFVYGSTATITATPTENNHFLHWISNGETLTANPYSFTVTSDRSLTAYFERDKHQITVLSNDTAIGRAWFIVGNNSEHYHSAALDHGTLVWLYAEARTDVPSVQTQFDGWSDGVDFTMRSIYLNTDTTLTALFSSTPVSIADGSTIKVITRGLTVTVSGAAGRNVRLFDLKGRKLYDLKAGEPTSMTVNTPGVYLLSVEGFPVRKVVLIN
ncbi:MAG: M6 family metalloprotease domain-containing protein [Bacteroidales bacterium]|nr:M6 family metalloprotease domain-containing protein [Bacteroidales bacterium]